MTAISHEDSKYNQAGEKCVKDDKENISDKSEDAKNETKKQIY